MSVDAIRDIFWQPLRIADHDKANEALDALVAEGERMREALNYYAEGRYPDGGEIARKALLAWECAKCGEAIADDLPLGRPHDCEAT